MQQNITDAINYYYLIPLHPFFSVYSSRYLRVSLLSLKSSRLGPALVTLPIGAHPIPPLMQASLHTPLFYSHPIISLE